VIAAMPNNFGPRGLRAPNDESDGSTRIVSALDALNGGRPFPILAVNNPVRRSARAADIAIHLERAFSRQAEEQYQLKRSNNEANAKQP
jgi:hypothetical protein